MLYKLNKITLLALTLVASLSASDTKWDTMYYKFIQAPRNQARSFLYMTTKVGAAITSAITTTHVIDKANNRLNQPIDRYLQRIGYSYFNQADRIKGAIELISGSFSGICTYFLIDSYLINKYEREALIDVLNNWNRYKKDCPTELIQTFESALEAKNLQNLESHVQEIIHLTKKKITEHYKPKQSGSWFSPFTAKFFNANVSAEAGSVLSGIAKIIEAIKKSNN